MSLPVLARGFGASCLVMVGLGAAACGRSSSPTTPTATPAQPTATTTTAATTTIPTTVIPTTGIPACPGVGTPLFDALPIAAGDFLAFRPLGFLSTPIHMFPAKHSAFSMTLPGATPMRVPVRSPGRAWIKEIWEASFSSGGQNYQLYLYPCSDVRVYMGHVATISEKLMTEMRRVPPSCGSFADGTGTVTICRHENLAVSLESGEQIGTGPDTAGIDFGLVDFRLPPAGFIRIEHYDYFYPFWAAPLEYFTAEARTMLAAKTGSVYGSPVRTATPIGGTHMQDVAGTAQGNWFPPGVYHKNSTDLSPMLALASDYVNPSQPIMAIGNSIRCVSMGLYSYAVELQGFVNRAFRSIVPDGNVYCFDRFLRDRTTGGLSLGQPPGVLLMAMPNGTTLRVELAAASTCAASSRTLTANATTFER